MQFRAAPFRRCCRRGIHHVRASRTPACLSSVCEFVLVSKWITFPALERRTFVRMISMLTLAGVLIARNIRSACILESASMADHRDDDDGDDV